MEMTGHPRAHAVPAMLRFREGCLCGAKFDSLLIGGTLAISVAFGVSVHLRPHWFALLFTLNLWLLGYHHVIATWTRLVANGDTARQHRFQILGLPLLVFAAVWAIGTTSGVRWLGSLYLYWQWYHYVRQGYGLSRLYEGRATSSNARPDRLTNFVLYSIPFWGILFRSHQAPDRFLGLEVVFLPVPATLHWLVGGVAILSLLVWMTRQCSQWWHGGALPLRDLFVLSHVAVFATGYLLIPSLDHGWLAINIWHNAQYILLVWLFHSRRAGGEVALRMPDIAALARPSWRSVLLYGVLCLTVTTVVYGALERIVTVHLSDLPAAAILVYLAINVHHYLVDARIWRVRDAGVRRSFRLREESPMPGGSSR